MDDVTDKSTRSGAGISGSGNSGWADASLNGHRPNGTPDVFSTPRQNQGGAFERGWIAMAAAGYTGMTPLRKSDKLPAMKGVTGRLGVQLRPGEYAGKKSLAEFKRHNIGWRLEGYVGIDVDQYGNKHGAEQIAALEAEHGPLPAGPSTTSRGDGPSRIRPFRLPDGADPKEEFRDGLGPDIDVIQRHHRTIVVWPSVHPKTGETYRWYDKHGNLMPEGQVPALDDFPVLPGAWLELLRKPQREHRPGAGLRVNEAIERWTSEADPDLMDRLREKFTTRDGSRHGTMLETLGWAARMAQKGKVNMGASVDVLEDLWYEAFDVPGSREPKPDEFNDLVDKAVGDVPPPGADEDAAEGQEQADEAARSRLDTMRAKLLDRSALKKLPPPEYMIKGWLNKRSSARMNGDPGSGKSLHLLDMAGCVGAGIPWHGCETKQGLVVYVIAEGIEGFTKRVAAWERQYGRELENVIFYPEPVQILEKLFGVLDESAEWGVFRELCKELNPSLVILDTQRRVTLAAEENGNSDLQKAVGALDALKRDTGCTWLLGHHTPKNGSGGSGGGSMWGSVDTEWETAKKGRGLEARFLLTDTKQKDGADGMKLEFRLAVHDVTAEFPGIEGVDPWADPITSVALVPDEQEETDRSAEVDLSLPDGINAREKVRVLLRRTYGNGGVFTRAEAKGLVVREANAMTPATFYSKWTELLEEDFIKAELSESGRELSRFRVDTSSTG
ncbi:AAA family ATPase [Streptomyces sp. NPDC093544]|uniref:AAA family ATPase n=1 Tax=Streptomyces sp. NPDC093544 TaxID=3155200 RepID=UPI0034144F10